MPESYRVIDLFAGPGGLAEGFASLRRNGKPPFEIALSVEKEPSAHRTLLLRSFLRQFKDEWPSQYAGFLAGGEEPDWAELHPVQWRAAQEHALELELGSDKATEQLRPLLAELAKDDTIVIGGPPCQAYSVVGRNRNASNKDYKASEDKRHYLYREYIEILKAVRPVAFVMENVKGLLSAKVEGVSILDLVLDDLRAAGGEDDSYRLVALSPPMENLFDSHEPTTAADFLIECEHFGVPQARHRMIIVGIRADHASFLETHRAGPLLPRWTTDLANVEHALSGLPELRSGLSRDDSFENWHETMKKVMEVVIGELEESDAPALQVLHESASLLAKEFAEQAKPYPRMARRGASIDETCPEALRTWLEGRADGVVANHDSRGHMASDLARYFFSAVFTRHHDRSPRAEEFPSALAPDHANWDTGKFVDRFRVQREGRASTTITSHISKDGHYFIHPDPLQCRALTVREAARLQTFPDDYLFLGNRTQQFVQVGNAVPPFIARQIGEALLRILSHPDNVDDEGSEDGSDVVEELEEQVGDAQVEHQ